VPKLLVFHCLPFATELSVHDLVNQGETYL
jgi:hypothetical protein